MKIRLAVVAIAAILVVGLLMGSSATSAAGGVTILSKTGDGSWDGTTWKVAMCPGETKTTTVRLYNSSGSKLNLQARVKPKSLERGDLIFELDDKNFTIAKKSYAEVTLVVTASSSVRPGTYSVGLEIKAAGRGAKG
jgi:hypothetical protein